jgi:hypothetical protein
VLYVDGMKRALGLVLLGATGCVLHSTNSGTPQPSGGAETSQIQASLSAQSDGQTIQVYAALMKDAFLELSAGDALTASLGGGAPIKLLESRDGETVHYVGSLPQPKDKATVTIAFTRGTGAGATSSSVDLPPFFTAQPLPAQVTKSGTLPIRLTGYTQYFAAIEVKGACIQGDGRLTFQLDPSQHADVALSQLTFTNGASFPCDVDVYVRSELSGKCDPAFKTTSSFEGLEQLALKTTITP